MASSGLHRSNSHRMVLGVCGGLAETFNMDPMVMRMTYLIASLISGLIPGLGLYILLGFIMPDEAHGSTHI